MENEKHVPDVDDDDYDDDDDHSRVCGENSRCPWKNCAVQGFDCFQKQSCLKLRSQRHGRQLSQTVTLKVAHAGAWNFFPRNFSSCNFRIFSSQQKGLMLKVSWFMWETEFSLENERTKGCFLLAHNLKSNKVSVRDKFLLDVQNAPPLWKKSAALLGFTS